MDEKNNTPVNSPRSETPDVIIERSIMNSPFPHIRGQMPRMDTLNQERVRNTYICCGGGVVDRRVLNYVAQLLVSVIVLIFCIVKLMLSNSDDHPLYISILSSILGYYLGNVGSNKK